MQQDGAAGSPGEGGQAEFLASIVALPDETSRREAIVKNYASMDGEGISTVVARAEQEGGVWKEMLEVLQELTNARQDRIPSSSSSSTTTSSSSSLFLFLFLFSSSSSSSSPSSSKPLSLQGIILRLRIREREGGRERLRIREIEN